MIRTKAAALCVALSAILGAPGVTLAHRSEPEASPPASAADFGRALNPDGTFVGAQGVSGAVDTRAWTLVSDLASGEAPRFAPAPSVGVEDSQGNTWLAYGSGGSIDGVVNGPVYAVAVTAYGG